MQGRRPFVLGTQSGSPAASGRGDSPEPGLPLRCDSFPRAGCRRGVPSHGSAALMLVRDAHEKIAKKR